MSCGKNTCKRIVDDDGEGKNQPERTREVMNEIHTDVVKDTLDTLAPNRISNQRPPIINPNEKTLPRKTRVIKQTSKRTHKQASKRTNKQTNRPTDGRTNGNNLKEMLSRI